MEPVEHDEGVRIVKTVVAVRFWVVSKVNAKEAPVVRAGCWVPIVEMAIGLLVVLALFLVPALPDSLASWKLGQVLVFLLAHWVVLGYASQVLAQAHSMMV